MRRKRHFEILVLVLIFFTFFNGGWASSTPKPKTPCEICDDLKTEIKSNESVITDLKNQLQENHRLLKELKPDEDAKRMRMDSKLFAIAAKIETYENRNSAKKIELTNELKKNCKKCSQK